MKRDLILAGLIGLVVSLFIFLGANWLKRVVPVLFPDVSATLVIFVFLLLVALVEMPMMVFALRKMAQSATAPRRLITLGFWLYVVFASVYAAMYVLLTGDNYFSLGTVLAALALVRFASGVLVR